jgi:hypothetical protein
MVKIMPLTKLQFKPGINRETTSYANEGGWFESNKIRFRFGVPEKIGGWVKNTANIFLGTCRSLHSWVSLDGTVRTGVGTNLKFYVKEGSDYNDITPLRIITAAGDITFSATNGSSLLNVSNVGHGAVVNDFVTYSGAVSLGGNITADVLNQEYQIVSILNSATYTIVAKNTSGATVTATAGDSGNGGSSVVGAYQINVGLDTTVFGTGWGAGTWSRGTWGSPATLTAPSDILRIWTQDNFGQDLIFNVRDGGVYYFNTNTGGTAYPRATALSDNVLADSTTPTIAKEVLVSDIDRHVLMFGCDPENNIGTQDPLLIRFSNQEDPFTWTSTATNTAGSLRLGSGSTIETAIETRQQTLVFTDVSLHSLQFLGPPFTFGIQMVAENITIMSPLAATPLEDVVYWMGQGEFYMYNGRVDKLPCTVKSYVFNNINLKQKEKIFACTNSAFNEVWWFYPSALSSEIDSYVVFNYIEQVWYFGTLSRTAWQDRGISDFPLAASSGYLYDQENGLDDGSQDPALPISSYIESSQMDLGEGDNFAFINRLIPDITFEGSQTGAPTVDFTVKTRNFPGGNYLQSTASAVTQTATVPVEQFTNQIHLRLRGRSFALRVDSDDVSVMWRLGAPRLDIRTDGRR